MHKAKKTSHIKTASDRSVGLVFSIVFALVGLWPLIDDGDVRGWALVLSVLLALIAQCKATLLNPLNRAWSKFAVLLGVIATPIVMTLVFFLIITPTAIVLRTRKKDLLNLNIDKRLKSYWIEREEPVGPMKNQF